MKIHLIAIAAFSLAGCATDDMLNNKFPTIVIKPAENLAGIWTGALGPYMSTLKINSDGSGYSCYSWNDKKSVDRIKFDGENIYFQEGTRLRILTKDSSMLKVNAPYGFGKDYTYTRDDNLKQASPYCVREIKTL